MRRPKTRALTTTLLAGLLAAVLGLPEALAKAPPGQPPAAHDKHQAAPVATTRRETQASWNAHHAKYFQRNWGVDIVGIHRVSSGFMLRFNYRVVEPGRAAALTDKTQRPYLIDEATHTALAVPAMENIGELRQVAPLETNRTYYMIFGNPGGLVKRGGRVTLVVGNFRAEGLVVD